MKTGTFTALITPFKGTGEIDWQALRRNIEFQIANRIDGLVPCGTTGESPTLSPHEHSEVIDFVVKAVAGRAYVLAGTGSNNSDEAIEYCLDAVTAGVNGLLLVDCYYNKPTSTQLLENYYRPIAQTIFGVNPNIDILPYIIPGRTAGTGLLPPELLELATCCSNVTGVKEATGNRANMALIRELLGPKFVILSGDDALTFEMMTSEKINAQGVVSVITNVLPRAVSMMVNCLKDKEIANAIGAAGDLQHALSLIFSQVSVRAVDPIRKREFTYPNPCGIKFIMSLFGMDSGFLRHPLGPLPQTARAPMIAMLDILANNSDFLDPIFAEYGKQKFIEAHLQ